MTSQVFSQDTGSTKQDEVDTKWQGELQRARQRKRERNSSKVLLERVHVGRYTSSNWEIEQLLKTIFF